MKHAGEKKNKKNFNRANDRHFLLSKKIIIINKVHYLQLFLQALISFARIESRSETSLILPKTKQTRNVNRAQLS